MKSSITRTLTSLERVINSNYPTDEKLWNRHDEKVSRAQDYIKELTEASGWLPEDVTIVAKSTFQRIIDRSDFVEMEELEYLRIASVINYPETGYKTYLWLTPVSEL